MAKYLGIKFKDGEYKKYEWDKIDFFIDNDNMVFAVRSSEGELLFELLLAAPLENIKYYERIEE